MLLSLIQTSRDPRLNLAAEDFLLHQRTEDFVILSINDPSVIMGKHQVANREVNTRFTDSLNIPVLRRISGGGTVYHDQGNLNFAFIRNSEQGRQVDFALYTEPVVSFLKSLGIDAVFGGKNDITVNGLKISGNAEHVFRERVLHHGTLLFNASLDNLRSSLKPETGKYSSRGVESNRTSVTNLKGMPGVPGTIEELRDKMLEFIGNRGETVEKFSFSAEEAEKVQNLAETKYNTWEWNFGYGPQYTFNATFEFAGKPHCCRFIVKDGIIWESFIEGSNEMAAAGKKLIGCRHMFADVAKIIRSEAPEITDDELYFLF